MNAKEELLEFLNNDHAEILAASIKYKPDCDKYTYKETTLFNNFTLSEYEKLINKLSFEYDNGYGLQELYRYLWFIDSS